MQRKPVGASTDAAADAARAYSPVPAPRAPVLLTAPAALHEPSPAAHRTSQATPKQSPRATSSAPRSATTGLKDRLRSARLALFWLLPTLVVAAAVNVTSLVRVAPRTTDENTYVAYAWALNAVGEMAGFSPLVEHPPLGWMQIAAYARLTGAFDRWDVAVMAGREAMLFFTLLSVALLWLLARRLRFSYAAATAAALIFAVAPLGVASHGTVSLDNVGTPWLLLAFLLAMSRRRQLAAFIGSATAFSVAVLSKETFLVALPILIWLLVRSSRPHTRVYTVTAAIVTVEVVLGTAFVVADLLNQGTPVGPETRTDALPFSLGTTGDLAGALTGWWQLDAALLAVAAVASIAGLLVYRTRPFSVLTLAVGALLLLPAGMLPLSFVTMAIPFAALVIAGVVDAAVVVIRRRGVRRSVAPIGVVAAVAAGALVAAPLWTMQLSGLLWGEPDEPVREAQAWLADNADAQQRLVVDDAMLIDLVRAGWAGDALVGYRAIETAAAPAAGLPEGWRSADFVVTAVAGRPQLAEALAGTRVVAAFGGGADAVEVRQVIGATDDEPADEADSVALRRELGQQLAENPAIVLWSADRALLMDGRVDERIIAILGALSASGDVEIAGFPMVDGEQDLALRTVALFAIDDQPLAYGGQGTLRGEALVNSLVGTYSPDQISFEGNRLVLRFPHSTGEPAE